MLSNSNIPLEERVDMDPSEKKMYRALIRINSIDFLNNKIGFAIPGWNAKKTLYFDIKKMPEFLMQNIKRGMPYRFHAPVNIGAKRYNNVYIDISSSESE